MKSALLWVITTAIVCGLLLGILYGQYFVFSHVSFFIAPSCFCNYSLLELGYLAENAIQKVMLIVLPFHLLLSSNILFISYVLCVLLDKLSFLLLSIGIFNCKTKYF